MKNPGSETGEHLQLSYKKSSNGGLDLSSLLRGKDVDASVRETFFRLYDYFKDELRDSEDEYRARIRKLKEQLKEEQQERKDSERDDAEKSRLALRGRRDLEKAVKTTRRWAVGMSAASLMIVSAFEVDRYAEKEPDNVLIEQLNARVESFDEIIQSREKQVQHYMYGENDRYGALLKAVDALKAQVGEMQWYVNDDTRNIMSDLKSHLDRLNTKPEGPK